MEELEIEPLRDWFQAGNHLKLGDFVKTQFVKIPNGFLSLYSWKSIEDWPELPSHLRASINVIKDCLAFRDPFLSGEKDQIGWTGARGKSDYSVKRGCKALESQGVNRHDKKWRMLWDLPGLPKVNFFVWLVFHKSISTNDNLSQRGFLGPSRCILCKNQAETVCHLFLECPFCQRVWGRALSMLGNFQMEEIRGASVDETVSHWIKLTKLVGKSSNWGKSLLYAFSLLPKFLLWSIWLERNNEIFNESPPSLERVLARSLKLTEECIMVQKIKESDFSKEKDFTLWNEGRLVD